jgi:hypothetical protein
MRIRRFTLAALLSLSLSVATAVIWALSYGRPGGLNLGRDYSVQWLSGHLEISNLHRFILDGVSDTRGGLQPRDRRAPKPPAAEFHRFAAPCGAISLVFALLPTVWLIRIWRRQLRTERHGYRPLCGSCGYSLVGNSSGVCPECGVPVSVHPSVHPTQPDSRVGS